MDEPEAYQMPNAANAVLPRRNNVSGYLATAVTAVLGVIGGLIALRRRREPPPAEAAPVETADVDPSLSRT
jgi:formate dehydrogenase iron-sulfur subunit